MDGESKELEEQVVTDTDADTRDATDTTNADFAAMSARMDSFEQMQTQMFDMLKSIKSAQADMVMSGNAVISENADSDMADGFVPLEELDFSLNGIG